MIKVCISLPSTSGFRQFASKNTKNYLRRQLTDEFAIKAREHDYRARSAFKLLEIDQRFGILKEGSTVLDVGCAPGSWLQVCVEKTRQRTSESLVVGVDLQHVLPIAGAVILSNSDITALETQEKLKRVLKERKVDVVLSDMAPNPTGDNATDHIRLINLCRAVFRLFSDEENRSFELAKNGVFVCKIWDGVSRKEFMTELEEKFSVVKTVKAKACRDNSAEMYLYCAKPKQ